MIRVVIIDDEKNNVGNLDGLLRMHSPNVQVAATANNGMDGIAIINQQRPDVVFLDIQMPAMNGFEMLQQIGKRDFDVIFVTAFDQYGIQAVKFAAIDYLLKPVDIAELKAAVAGVEERKMRQQGREQLENLLFLIQNRQQKHEHRLALSTLKETRFVNPSAIIRCESSNAYTSFFLSGGEKLMVSRPIFEYEELLAPYGFIRCHQSHLVNRAHVRSWVKEDGGYLLLDDGSQVPVSRNKKEMVTAGLRNLDG